MSDTHHQTVLQHCQRIATRFADTQKHLEWDDLAQEAALAVFKQERQRGGPLNERFEYKVARAAMVDYARRELGTSTRSLARWEAHRQGFFELDVARDMPVEGPYRAIELQDQLQRILVLAGLKRTGRERVDPRRVLVLLYWFGSAAATAEQLGLTQSGVSRIIERVRVLAKTQGLG